MFQRTYIGDDEYVYNVDIKVTNSVDKDRYTKKWVIYFQIRRSELVRNAKYKVYGLYKMREIKNGACLGLYMGELVDSDGNEKEEYQYGKLRAERCNPYMGMHPINNPIYHAYGKAYACDKEKHCNVEKENVKVCNQKKVNVIIMNGYLVKATRRIVAGDEIQTLYD